MLVGRCNYCVGYYSGGLFMMPKVTVVIPTIGKDRMIIDLLQQIAEDDDDIVRYVYVMDNGMDADTRKDCKMFSKVVIFPCEGLGIYAMWNKGVEMSLTLEPEDYIAILNDDLILTASGFFTSLVEPMDLNDDIWATCGNYDRRQFAGHYHYFPGTFKDGGFAGFCFAVRGTAYEMGLPPFEEQYVVWYGDDDLLHNIAKRDKLAVMAKDATMIHINGGSNTFGDRCRLVNDENAKDTEIYMKKWHTHA